MKTTQNNNLQGTDIFPLILEGTKLAESGALDIAVGDEVCVIHKAQMTALELAQVIDSLSTIASDLTVALAAACGQCDNCGDANPEICADCKDNEVCALLNGCKDTPADWVRNCSLCQGPFDKSLQIFIPDYLLGEAGIPKGAKLDAYADEDSGEIVVVEADCQLDITDVPEGVLAVLSAAGVCLAELDELIMLEEIVYGA